MRNDLLRIAGILHVKLVSDCITNKLNEFAHAILTVIAYAWAFTARIHVFFVLHDP